MDIGVIDILKMRGFEFSGKCLFVRHQHSRYPIEELRRNEWIDLYQRYQGRDVFGGVEQFVSFCGLPGTRASFYGVYRVLNCRPAAEGTTIPGCIWSEEWKHESCYFYDFEEDSRFTDLRGRIVIDWGKGTRKWDQIARNKPVLEIRESGRCLPPFEDYLEFSLSYAQLKSMFANEEAHREWRTHLSAVSGVYLILAETSGDLYVGSAYGQGGIWARWRQYAKTKHGGNVMLRELISTDRSYPDSFRFSVLQVLPKTMTQDEVIRREAIYKSKLGSRAKGLNLN